MKTFARLLVLGIALMSGATWAAAPATRAAEDPNRGPVQPDVAELDVPAGSTVLDLLKRVQDSDPNFQYVVQPGPWEKALLPQMRLRAVSLQQIVEMLTNIVPDLEVSNLSKMGVHPLYVFNGRSRQPAEPRTQLVALGLADPVERIAVRNAWAELAKGEEAPTSQQLAAARKTALQDVLSLLEAAISQADSAYQPSLKMHEQTEVLLVRGTAAQLNAASQALAALQAGPLSRDQSEAFIRLQRENAALKSRLKEGSGKNGSGEKH